MEPFRSFSKISIYRIQTSSEKVQMQAILDGRDSGNFSSIKNSDKEEGFL